MSIKRPPFYECKNYSYYHKLYFVNKRNQRLKMRDLFKELVDEKGFSAKWTTFEQPDKRYIVGISGLKFQYTGLESEFKKALNTFFESFEDTPGWGFGAWDEKGILYLDTITQTDSLDEAFDLARKHNQVAIYDKKDKKVIYL